MISNYTRYTTEHVGMVEYQSYWRTYCLILDVDEENQVITCLDAFAPVNSHPVDKATVRVHRTAPDARDKLFTVPEFYQIMEARKADLQRQHDGYR